MKKKLLIRSLAIGFICIFPHISYAATTLPSPIDGKITLNENVELNNKYQILENDTLIIDLNGFTLTGPDNNYAIDNQGNLTIIDSKGTGHIQCNAPSASCIRNNHGTLIIKGITINGAFVLVKTEPDSITHINNSNFTTTYNQTNTGAILNWGTTNVTATTINAPNSAGIYTSSGEDEEDKIKKNSLLNITNCVINAKRTIYATNGDRKLTTKNEVHINGLTIKNGPLYLPKDYGTIATITGEIKYPGNLASAYNQYLYPYAIEGAKLIPTSDITFGGITINKGVTLVISEGIKATLTNSGNNSWIQILGTVEGEIANENILDVENNKYWNLPTPLNNGKMTETKYKLLNNITSKLSINRTLEIDLNGYTIAGDITLSKNASVIIEDNSLEKNGKVIGTIENNGNLIIKNGSFSNVPLQNEGAQTILQGGTYPTDQMKDTIISENMEWVTNDDGTYSLQKKNVKDFSNDNTPENQRNVVASPKTFDKIWIYLSGLIISFIGLGITLKFLTKQIRIQNN